MQALELILASASPRRKALLQQIGLTCTVQPSHVAEPSFHGGDPARYAESLAELKTAEISGRNPDKLVIGADTIVVLDKQVLGKPKDVPAARRMLQQLSGRTHTVITAYSLQVEQLNLRTTRHVSTQVHFRELSTDMIDTYIGTGSPFDKAGAYGIQDYSGIFVDHIDGCFYNVVGFPLADFYATLQLLLTRHQLHLSASL